MIISTTELRVKDLLQLPLFFRLSKASVEQARRAPGNLQVSVRGTLLSGMTLTAWKDEASMMAYRNSGAHAEAMRNLKKLPADTEPYGMKQTAYQTGKKPGKNCCKNLSESFKKKGAMPPCLLQ